jgi:hypothetical protein
VTTDETVEIFKSLLQKAVRRGNVEMAGHAVRFLARHDLKWLKNRLAVLTYEECWTYGDQVLFSDDPKTVAEQIARLATAAKNRNSAGLGSLAFYWAEGDASVLDGGQDDVAIKLVAEGFKNPRRYWSRTIKTKLGKRQETIVSNACKGFAMAEFGWDKCFMVAASYLALSDKIPATSFAEPSTEEFPLWITIDKHTKIGQAAINRAARRVNFDEEKAQWLVFYLEGVRCNKVVNSPWWERETRWRFKQLELNPVEVNKCWKELRPVLMDELNSAAEEIGLLIDL